jgi:hypothetical protein
VRRRSFVRRSRSGGFGDGRRGARLSSRWWKIVIALELILYFFGNSEKEYFRNERWSWKVAAASSPSFHDASKVVV